MSINSRQIENWKQFCKVDLVSFFQTPDWYLLWYDQSAISLLEFLSKEQKVILPLVKVRQAKGMINQYISSPAYTYGGLLMDHRQPSQELMNQIQNKLNKYSNIYVLNNPFSKHPIFNQNDQFTQLIRLDQITSSTLNNWSKHHQRNFNKSKNEKLVVKLSNEWFDWKSYFDLYAHVSNIRETGSANTYKEEIFEGIFSLKEHQRKLWLCFRENKLVSGILCCLLYTSPSPRDS